MISNLAIEEVGLGRYWPMIPRNVPELGPKARPIIINFNSAPLE